MTCSLSQLRELLDGEGLRYYLIPDQDGVMLTMIGSDNHYQFKILLEFAGEFLQFRSINNLHCPLGHPHLDAALQVLGELNYRLRLIKFGWDPADGEIVAYADCWIEDAVITQVQFGRMAGAFMSILDDEHPRIKEAIESGVVPAKSGDEDEKDEEVIDSL